jgi:uncharacterized protein YdhG (YjbR/CyaY superfamily)
MRNYNVKNVDDYIASSSKEARPTLEELRKVILLAVPNVEEGISWGVPFYRDHGLLAGFAVFTNHVSFGLAFPIENSVRKSLEEKGYKTGNKTVQIRFDQQVPVMAIKHILKARVVINKAKKR